MTVFVLFYVLVCILFSLCSFEFLFFKLCI